MHRAFETSEFGMRHSSIAALVLLQALLREEHSLAYPRSRPPALGVVGAHDYGCAQPENACASFSSSARGMSFPLL
jgi:hypothetical protein